MFSTTSLQTNFSPCSLRFTRPSFRAPSMPPKSRRPVLPSPLRGLSASGRQLMAGVTAWRLTCLKMGFVPLQFMIIYDNYMISKQSLNVSMKPNRRVKTYNSSPKLIYIPNKKTCIFEWVSKTFGCIDPWSLLMTGVFFLYGLISGRLPENVWNHVNLKRVQCTNNKARKQNKTQPNKMHVDSLPLMENNPPICDHCSAQAISTEQSEPQS